MLVSVTFEVKKYFQILQAKRLAVLDKTEWAFLVLSTVSILAVGTMTIYKIVEAARDIPSSESEEDRLRDLFFAITLFVNLGNCQSNILTKFLVS